MLERLHKFMASAGVASRRKSEELILAGRVRVNGKRVTELGTKIEPSSDVVEVNGHVVRPQKTVVIAMNKPKGVVTTMSDERGRKTVIDFLPALDVAVKPIGRLDMNTEGLLLFTNDGELAARLTHPSRGVWKTYRVVAKGEVSERELEKLRKGVYIVPEDPLRTAVSRKREAGGFAKKTAEATAKTLKFDAKRELSHVEISIHEGRKRQIRLMFQAIGRPVVELKRVRFGPISLGKLPAGACRRLSKKEEQSLRSA